MNRSPYSSYSQPQYSPYYPPPQQSSNTFKWIVILIIAIAVISGLVYYFFFYKGNLGSGIGGFFGGVVGGLTANLTNNQKCQTKYKDPRAFGTVDGTCYTCPTGMTHNGLVAPDNLHACVGVGKSSIGHIYGTPADILNPCEDGFKFDIVDNACYQCPPYYNRTALASIYAKNACSKGFLGSQGVSPAITKPRKPGCSKYSPAPGQGSIQAYIPTNKCFSCPAGYRHDLTKDPGSDGQACVQDASTQGATSLGPI